MTNDDLGVFRYGQTLEERAELITAGIRAQVELEVKARMLRDALAAKSGGNRPLPIKGIGNSMKPTNIVAENHALLCPTTLSTMAGDCGGN